MRTWEQIGCCSRCEERMSTKADPDCCPLSDRFTCACSVSSIHLPNSFADHPQPSLSTNNHSPRSPQMQSPNSNTTFPSPPLAPTNSGARLSRISQHK